MLAVDGQRVQETTQYGTARLLDVSSARLYVGGVGVAGRAAAVDARLDSLRGPVRGAAGSLRGGCIRNFKVDLTFTAHLKSDHKQNKICNKTKNESCKTCTTV